MLRHIRQAGSTACALLVACMFLGACGRSAAPGWDEGGQRPDRNKPREANTETEDEWAGRPAAHAEELFEGRFPGVQVYRVGDGIAVRIRGASTIMGDNAPLYVVDDMPIEPGPDGALIGLNPADIDRIEVLKDVGATALYGGRGANGVILIRTRKGK